VLFSTGPELLPQHLPPQVRECLVHAPMRWVAPPLVGSLLDNRHRHERSVIEVALREARNGRTRAANLLGISRATLYNKMRQYGISKMRMVCAS
jgi:DNA-binding NtrC family response regulator